MSRKVFYSFHFDKDSQRAAQIRNSHAIADVDEYGVIDSVDWEEIKRSGPDSIKRWINDQLKYTSVTVVLIGAETSERQWVQYEIERSWERGNGLVGVTIHNVKNLAGETTSAGKNPFDKQVLADGTPLSAVCKVYDWVADGGLANLGKWSEEAFEIRSNYKGNPALKGSPVKTTTPTPVQTISNPSRPWAL
ncbi:TIR domain-containing protein [Patescibacteria group bacterium]|jgi:hypothetical protein|nr:TIR domain-containing protein [Patescibacteria group bacterium]